MTINFEVELDVVASDSSCWESQPHDADTNLKLNFQKFDSKCYSFSNFNMNLNTKFIKPVRNDASDQVNLTVPDEVGPEVDGQGSIVPPWLSQSGFLELILNCN